LRFEDSERVIVRVIGRISVAAAVDQRADAAEGLGAVNRVALKGVVVLG